MATLRQLGPIDRMLDPCLQREPPEAVRMILRLGAAQLFHLDTPAYAAVDSSVALTQTLPETRGFKALVNAVLRRLGREGQRPAEPADFAPPWLFARWRAAFGEEAAKGIAAQIGEEPGTDLTPRDPADAPALAEALEATPAPPAARCAAPAAAGSRSGRASRRPLVGAGRRRRHPGALAQRQARRDGRRPLRRAGRQGAAARRAGATVTAVDRSGQRLGRLADGLARTGLKAEVITADAETWPDPRQFDAVLLDAPCSSTGTFRRNPDVLWTLRPPDISKAAGVQTRLLDAGRAPGEAGRPVGLLRLLAGTRRGRGPGPRLSEAPS
ncbi:MAG: transcription antitermination factor NusB [Caulobacteraceae bacterium]